MVAQRGDNHESSQSATHERVLEIHSSMVPVSAFNNSPLHLTIEKLNSKNYREWAQAIKLVIDGKGKLGLLIDETWRPPRINVAASQKWWSENSFITSCLKLHEASHWQNLYLPPNNKGCVGCDTGNIFRCREYFPNL